MADVAAPNAGLLPTENDLKRSWDTRLGIRRSRIRISSGASLHDLRFRSPIYPV